jgi:hypothetical protein
MSGRPEEGLPGMNRKGTRRLEARMTDQSLRRHPMNELTVRLESLLRRLHAAAQGESDPGAARFSAQFRAELQSLIFEFGPEAVHAALDGLLDVASRSVSLH